MARALCSPSGFADLVSAAEERFSEGDQLYCRSGDTKEYDRIHAGDCTSPSQETTSQARNLAEDSIWAAFHVLKMLRRELKTQPRQWAANAE